MNGVRDCPPLLQADGDVASPAHSRKEVAFVSPVAQPTPEPSPPQHDCAPARRPILKRARTAPTMDRVTDSIHYRVSAATQAGQ